MSTGKVKKVLYGTLNALGQLIPDPTPKAPSVKHLRQPSMAEQVQAMIRSERLAQEAAAAGYETWEESEDFDVGDDDYDPRSPWEQEFDPVDSFAEMRSRRDEHEAAQQTDTSSADDVKGSSPDNTDDKTADKSTAA